VKSGVKLNNETMDVKKEALCRD